MNRLPIHQNLNTSFVNLTALVRFLHDLQFVGSIHVELSSYEADIIFTPSNKMQAREFDHFAGRSSQGERAFQRILIRAKEPCGRISVYPGIGASTAFYGRTFVDKSISKSARMTITGRSDTPVASLMLTTGVQRKSAENWSKVLNLTAELLKTIEESLAKANLHFSDAFRNACALNAEDYPFVNPQADIFAYKNGEFKVRDNIDIEIFTEAVANALARVFERLREEPKFAKPLLFTTHRIRALLIERRTDFDKFSITTKLKKVVGV